MKITYQEITYNGYTIRGLLSAPEEGYERLAVILHGYTGHKNENGFLFKQLTKTLVNSKIATLRFDYMGSGDSDGDFADQDFNTVLSDGGKILELGLKLNNDKKIILMGFSMGGAAAAKLSVKYADKIEKLVLMSPAGNMPLILENTFKYNPIIDDSYIDLGGYYLGKNFYESLQGVDMYEGVGNYTGEVLITQGSADVSVPPSFSEKYKTLFKNVIYEMIPDASHCYTKIEQRVKLNSVIRDFLK